MKKIYETKNGNRYVFADSATREALSDPEIWYGTGDKTIFLAYHLTTAGEYYSIHVAPRNEHDEHYNVIKLNVGNVHIPDWVYQRCERGLNRDNIMIIMDWTLEEAKERLVSENQLKIEMWNAEKDRSNCSLRQFLDKFKGMDIKSITFNGVFYKKISIDTFEKQI